MYKLKTFDKTVSDNWVRDLSEFRFLGLINFFKNINEINNAQSISDSFRQQRTAKTNKLVVEVKKEFIIRFMNHNNQDLFEKLHFDGFVLFPIDNKNELVNYCINEIKNVSEEKIKEGFYLDRDAAVGKEGLAADLKPSVFEYDQNLEKFYTEIGVVDFLEEFQNFKSSIATLQLRGAYGLSYLSWHRDTHYYSNAKAPSGNVPPIFKSIFYPNLHGNSARPTLHVSNGSHLRYFKNKNVDLMVPRTPFF